MSDLVKRLTANYLDKVFAAFKLQPGDHLVAITDAGVEEVCRKALTDAIWFINKSGIRAIWLESPIPTGPAQDFGPDIEEQMQDATALLYHTSMSRSHCPQTHKFLPTHGKREDGLPKARLISITNGFADTLINGAVNEDLGEMRERIARINTLTKHVVRYHLTSPAGTDLWVIPWIEKMVIDNGLIDTPGKMGNFPFGEGRSTAVKFLDTWGALVSDGVIGAGIGQVDEPIRMEIFNGKIMSLTGGRSADLLRAQMEAADAKLPFARLRDPSFWLAEFAFGANAAAWRIKDGKKVLPPTSLEAEKAYDPDNTTVHIAHGANHVFGVPENDPQYNPVQHHTDHVIWGGVTVEATDDYGHQFFLIKDGTPVY